jgi:hypothetical protein
MDVLKEVVKTVLLDVMFRYSCLEDCIECEFKHRIKTQKGIDAILALADFSDILNYYRIESDVVDPLDFYNTVIYSIANELIETDDVKFEFRTRCMKFI